jgi:hypothetical protein
MELDPSVYQLCRDLWNCGVVEKPQHALDRILVSIEVLFGAGKADMSAGSWVT